VGERATESPQNTYLSKIIILNDDISKLVRESKLAKIAKEAAGSEDGSDDGDSKSGNEEDQAAEATKKVVASNLSRIMGAWIQLQDAVNCYMDNAKDPNPLNSGRLAAGIRQVLERKEGMFRMNMMGKRVNFCCRSVISPDPFIVTNEIGIPKHFAMALHYPEPVNGFNVKHLRTLVERGPDQYPGSYLLSCSSLPR
jgi:DNA-directed RNA polymerase I subunit RPA1